MDLIMDNTYTYIYIYIYIYIWKTIYSKDVFIHIWIIYEHLTLFFLALLQHDVIMWCCLIQNIISNVKIKQKKKLENF